MLRKGYLYAGDGGGRLVKNCPWCCDVKRDHEKYNLEWSVIDDDFGQRVHNDLIHFCFFCGRPLDAIGEGMKNERV